MLSDLGEGGRKRKLAGGRSGAPDRPGERGEGRTGGDGSGGAPSRGEGGEGKWEQSRGVDGAQRCPCAARAVETHPGRCAGRRPMSRPRLVPGPQRESRVWRPESPGV